MTTCPFCAEQISDDASRCPYCKSNVADTPRHGPTGRYSEYETPQRSGDFARPPRKKSSNTTLIIVLSVVGGLVLLMVPCAILLLPTVSKVREAARRSDCKNKLKNIVLALHNYHETHGSFPPAFVVDKERRPLYSWRVLILPQLDQQALYEQFDLTKAWDAPENRRLLDQMPYEYGCPSHTGAQPGTTS